MKLHNFFRDNLLYLSLFSFIFISTSAFNFSATSSKPPSSVLSYNNLDEPVNSLVLFPVLRDEALFPIISAQSAYAIDLNSDTALYEKMPDKQMLPASTAKIITALVSLDYYPLDMVLTVGRVNVEGQKMKLIGGEKIKVEDLLYGLLIFSANDAAEVLAQNFPGGRDLFIASMNLKAKQLDLKNTYFANPAGLDGLDQYTTAKDLVRTSRVAMANELVAKIVATKEKEVRSIDGKISHKLVNLNRLIGEVDGVLGVKTGWTENARENLVAYIERDGKKVMIALLGSQDRFGETKELIEWIFESYEWKVVELP